MRSKWIALAAVTSFVFTGLALADDDSPLHQLMETVNKQNAALTKVFRTPTAFKKDKPKAVENAKDMLKLAHDSKKDTTTAKTDKEKAEWNRLSEDFIKKTQELSDALGKADTTQAQAKTAHNAVKASCTECHEVFRIDEP